MYSEMLKWNSFNLRRGSTRKMKLRIWWIQFTNLIIMHFSPFPYYYSIFQVQILSPVPCSETPFIYSLSSSHSVSDQFSHPLKTTGTIVLYFHVLFNVHVLELETGRQNIPKWKIVTIPQILPALNFFASVTEICACHSSISQLRHSEKEY
jgi:hypothetical protein